MNSWDIIFTADLDSVVIKVTGYYLEHPSNNTIIIDTVKLELPTIEKVDIFKVKKQDE